MAKRLQVILPDSEYEEIQRAARSREASISEWARQALIDAYGRESSAEVERKLAAIRAAVKYEFPAGDIDTMLAEIELGYISDRQS